MTNQRENTPYGKESEVFAQDEHITGPLIINLGLTELATEEQIIEAINARLAEPRKLAERAIYVAPIDEKVA